MRRSALSLSGGISTWFVDDLLPMINQAMPLRGDSLSKSISSSAHYLSTNSVNLRAAKERLGLVPLFVDVADKRFVEVVGGALEPRSVAPDEHIITTVRFLNRFPIKLQIHWSGGTGCCWVRWFRSLSLVFWTTG